MVRGQSQKEIDWGAGFYLHLEPGASLIGGTAFNKRFDGLTDDEPGVKLTRMPSLIDRAMKDYALIVPLCRWLNNALGYPRAKTR